MMILGVAGCLVLRMYLERFLLDSKAKDCLCGRLSSSKTGSEAPTLYIEKSKCRYRFVACWKPLSCPEVFQVMSGGVWYNMNAYCRCPRAAFHPILRKLYCVPSQKAFDFRVRAYHTS